MEKNAHFGQTACKIHYYNLCIRLVHEKFGVYQNRSKVIPQSKFPAGLGMENG